MVQTVLTLEEREAMIGLAAHDMLAPLRNARVLIDLVRDDDDGHSAEAASLLDAAHDVIERAEATTRDMVAYAHATSVETETEFALAEVVRDICVEHDVNRIADLSITQITVHTDATALRAALSLMLGRALHGVTPGRCVGVSAKDSGSGMIAFTVTDNGTPLTLSEEHAIKEGNTRAGVGFPLPALRMLARAKGGALRHDAIDGGTRLILDWPGRVSKD